jgi:hypothetical protein
LTAGDQNCDGAIALFGWLVGIYGTRESSARPVIQSKGSQVQ